MADLRATPASRCASYPDRSTLLRPARTAPIAVGKGTRALNEHTYNRRRRQRALGKLTPVEFELALAATPELAAAWDQSQPPSTEHGADPLGAGADGTDRTVRR